MQQWLENIAIFGLVFSHTGLRENAPRKRHWLIIVAPWRGALIALDNHASILLSIC